MEGTLLGVRSIALSQAYNFENHGRVLPWDVVESAAPELLRKLIDIAARWHAAQCQLSKLSGGRGEGRSGDRAGADDPWLVD
jgi:hypothetical protein